MNKNLKLSFILFVLSAVVMVAWRTLQKFFNGVGLNFVALIIAIALLIGLLLSNKYIYNRVKDLFFTLCILTTLESIVYFTFEFAIEPVNTGFLVYQNVLSTLGIIFLCYAMFRFITESKEVKIGFIEFILGNGKPAKQPKKAKELTNGTLEEKPNSVKEDVLSEKQTIKTEDVEILELSEEQQKITK